MILILMLLLTLLRSRLNSPQSCGFFERIAFNFMMSRLLAQLSFNRLLVVVEKNSLKVS